MSDKERLKRLREKQIASRDPGNSKIPGYDWKKHSRRASHLAAEKRRRDSRPFLIKMWDELPERWQGAIFGTLVGGVFALLSLLVLSPEIRGLALIPLLICGLVGFVIGKSLQDDMPY